MHTNREIINVMRVRKKEEKLCKSSKLVHRMSFFLQNRHIKNTCTIFTILYKIYFV